MTFPTCSRRTGALAFLVVAAVLCAFFIHPMAGLAPLVPIAFGALSQGSQSDIGRQLAAWGFYDPSGGPLRRVIAKTADYTIVDPFTATTGGDASGTLFTNRGALTTVIFTLPTAVPRLAGVMYSFLGIADFTIQVQPEAVVLHDTLIALNDITADSIAMSTGTQKIGGLITVMCDGTSWIAVGSAVGVTFTVAT